MDEKPCFFVGLFLLNFRDPVLKDQLITSQEPTAELLVLLR